MANFFTRLAERSLGLSPVVQPAIAPRFSPQPAIDETDVAQFSELPPRIPQTNTEHKQKPLSSPVPSEPSGNQLSPHSVSRPLASASDATEKPLPETIPSTLPPRSTVAPTQPDQARPSAAFTSIAPSQTIHENANSVASLEPFRVLHRHEHVSINGHPSLVVSSIPASLESQHNDSVPPRSLTQPEEGRDYTPQIPTPLVMQPGLRSIVPSPEVSQSLVDRASSPPTIRVSIGRVEVRAVMPTPPPPKMAPVRPRPAVSLAAYLKQRGGTHEQ